LQRTAGPYKCARSRHRRLFDYSSASRRKDSSISIQAPWRVLGLQAASNNVNLVSISRSIKTVAAESVRT
jgi:hypothetical protein